MEQNITSIPVEKLLFDPQNPRLPLELYGITDEGRILTHMLRDESLIELMKSIGESGYSVSEPLLVVPTNNDEYTVVEGNRRLAALKLLSSPELATVRHKSVAEVVENKKHAPTVVPSIVYDNRDSILDYLGYRHITGVKSWGALEKARYLKQLYDRHFQEEGTEPTYGVLAKMIGSRSDYVGKLLSALNLFDYAKENAYFGIDIDEKKFDFSILSTASSYENIYKYIGLENTGDINSEHIDKDNFQFVFERLYDPKLKIGESRELSSLSAVLGNETALEEYKKGASLSESLYFTSAPVEAFEKFLTDAHNSLQNAKNGLERLPDEIPELERLVQKVTTIEKMAKTIRGSLEATDL